MTTSIYSPTGSSHRKQMLSGCWYHYASFRILFVLILLLSIGVLSTLSSISTRSMVLSNSTPPTQSYDSMMYHNDCLLGVNRVKDIHLYSQNNEDGGLLQVLRCMGGHGTKEYFEFGSETGQEVNTRVLRELYGWKGHLLDGDNENPDISLHQEFFTPRNIVSLLEKYGASKTLDVLSIDCDYDDMYIMREILLAGYKPRILVTEYNRNLGPEWSVSVIAKPVRLESKVSWKADCYFGASARAMKDMAGAFGYTPVWSNGINLIFVRLEIAQEMKLQIPNSENFPDPLEPMLHASCDQRQWAVVDDRVLKYAVDRNVSHEEFVTLFSVISLKEYQYKTESSMGYRIFEKISTTKL